MHTVRQFCTLSFKEVGIDLRWEGQGVNEKWIDVKTNKIIVEVDSQYYRPCEVDELLGNPQKAKDILKWNPNKTTFEDLVKIMVKSDLLLVSK
jgi:GDPmannose 4,6-dehydratase